MAESRHIYYATVCPECGLRACVLQSTGYDWESEQGRAVCPEATRGHKCLGPCCHGCECVQAGECAEQDCHCDCHCVELRLHHLEELMQEEDKCRCPVCMSGVNPTVEYLPGYDGAEGHWISGRPRQCRYFMECGPNVISTFYDNSDQRNHRLERYFGACIVIDDEDADEQGRAQPVVNETVARMLALDEELWARTPHYDMEKNRLAMAHNHQAALNEGRDPYANHKWRHESDDEESSASVSNEGMK